MCIAWQICKLYNGHVLLIIYRFKESRHLNARKRRLTYTFRNVLFSVFIYICCTFLVRDIFWERFYFFEINIFRKSWAEEENKYLNNFMEMFFRKYPELTKSASEALAKYREHQFTPELFWKILWTVVNKVKLKKSFIKMVYQI